MSRCKHERKKKIQNQAHKSDYDDILLCVTAEHSSLVSQWCSEPNINLLNISVTTRTKPDSERTHLGQSDVGKFLERQLGALVPQEDPGGGQRRDREPVAQEQDDILGHVGVELIFVQLPGQRGLGDVVPVALVPFDVSRLKAKLGHLPRGTLLPCRRR